MNGEWWLKCGCVSYDHHKETKWQALPRHIIFNIAKKESGPYWDRLIKQPGKQWWLKADWSKWKDEDEDDDEEGKGFFTIFVFFKKIM